MSTLKLQDLTKNAELDRAAMSTVLGGNSWLRGLGPIAEVNVGISQNIAQVQNVDVNTLNNVGAIGAGFGPFSLNVSPSQWADTGIGL